MDTIWRWSGLKSRKSSKYLSYDESVELVAKICVLMGIPIPHISRTDAKYYDGEYQFFQIFLKERNTYETIVHEILHYIFDLLYLEKKENGEDEEDNFEHRIILALERPLADWAKKLYKSESK